MARSTRFFDATKSRLNRKLPAIAMFVPFLTQCATLYFLSFGCVLSQIYDQGKFDELRSKIEADVLDLATEVERLYEFRCDSALQGCSNANFNDCLSEFPAPECTGLLQYKSSGCGSTSMSSCSSLFDFTASVVSLPALVANGEMQNPTDPQVIESVCFSRSLDDWFVEKQNNDTSYWGTQFGGFGPSGMYFGSIHGSFRMYPGRGTEDCGKFDPRVRPWYIAASSGPKNVVMILDKSGSMLGPRMALLKEAAKRVVETLTVSDRVGIIAFDSDVEEISDNGYLYSATAKNKEILNDAIDKLEAGDKTNFFDAFQKGFDLIDRTAENEYNAPCNTAILFFTDGEMTYPVDVTPENVTALVQDRINRTESLTKHSVFLFTYSVSQPGEDTHTLPSELACTVKQGVWSKISHDDEIASSLSGYYRLFSLGLGGNSSTSNDRFVAWVEPFLFFTENVLGTTVSAPVYDRSKRFLGVVAIDLPLDALNFALTNSTDNSTTQESIRQVVERSTARCPTISLTLCQLESYRRQGSSGNDALCTSNCTEEDFAEVEEMKCDAVSDYPKDLWRNTNASGLSYSERVCCSIDPLMSSDQCTMLSSGFANSEEERSVKLGAIIGGTVGGFVGIVFLSCILLAMRKKRKEAKFVESFYPPPVAPPLSTAPVEDHPPPPTAPSSFMTIETHSS